MITSERLRELLDFDPPSGNLIWRQHKGKSIAGNVAGGLRPDGYVRIKLDQRDYMAHRLIWLHATGRWPTEIDHINGDRSDNRIENLRECTRSQNFANREPYKHRTMPKGVRAKGSKFTARIRKAGIDRHIGTFNTISEAREAYLNSAKSLFGEFARG